jgi:chromate transporter
MMARANAKQAPLLTFLLVILSSHTATILTILISTAWLIPIYLIGSGLVSLLALRNEAPQVASPPSGRSKELDSQQSTDGAVVKPETKVGMVLIISSAVILVGLMIWRALAPNSVIIGVSETFYRVGALIYGGGQVVLPMLITELVDTGLMTESSFLYGLTLINVLPGPLFNFSAFLGAVVAGFPGMILAWCAIFAPGSCVDNLSMSLWLPPLPYSLC